MTLPPAQNVVGPDAAMTGVGGTGLLVTLCEAEAAQPNEFVAVTV